MTSTNCFSWRPTPQTSCILLLVAHSLPLCLSASPHRVGFAFTPVDASIGRRHRRPEGRRAHQKRRPSPPRGPRLLTRPPPSTSSGEDYRGEIERILTRHGFGGRVVTLNEGDLSGLPMPAEMYDGGAWKLCVVVGLRLPSSASCEAAENPPLLEVVAMNDDGLLQEKKVVDVGQITTLWQDFPATFSSLTPDALAHSLQSNFVKARESLQNQILPTEKAMQNLYNGRIAGRSRPPHRGPRVLTKKQIPGIAARSSNPARLEGLLRNLLKVGQDRASRMVDSALAADYLYSDYYLEGDEEAMVRTMVAARVLAEDAASGGRFKRRPCLFVSARYGENDSGDSEVREMTLWNGGWIAVDPSVKSSTEGRKFAAASNDSKEDACVGSEAFILTVADERIVDRLECLAMGDGWKRRPDRGEEEDEKMLDLDVREALANMDLPLTPQGATSALIKIGRWSENSADEDNGKTARKLIEPWSPVLLDTAWLLASYEGRRREALARECSSSKKGPRKTNASSTDGLEGRTDLSSLPCICIDAKRATFRDDAIGIRLRSSTGRKLNKAASKWEILVHIADVSDVYFDGGNSDGNVILPRRKDGDMRLLRQAAERRGQSRYDLPLGPLHLLPPVALAALSLATNEKKTPNKCVTLWAYIDDRDGKLLEAGLERTIISSPSALSFADATALLESGAEEVPKSMAGTKALISVAERNLGSWSRHHRQRDRAARERERRLSTKELISDELHAASGTRARDDGVRGSFRRSQGHLLVDSSLELYSFAVGALMRRAKRPIPRAPGSGADRGGRLGTAPLRRYIDGIAQRQALSVLCGYGEPLTRAECIEVSKAAARASDKIAGLRSSAVPGRGSGDRRRPVSALYGLARHLASTGGIGNQRRVEAMSTGHNNEVVILGVGVMARCRGVKGTLAGGEKLVVRVNNIDPEAGLLDVSLV